MTKVMPMITHRKFKEKVTVHFRKRDDGGLQATCEAVPGFYLSGANPRDVLDDVVPAIEALMRTNVGIEVDVFPLKSAIYEIRERDHVASEAIPEEQEYVLERRAA